jgi:hypothetical protein
MKKGILNHKDALIHKSISLFGCEPIGGYAIHLFRHPIILLEANLSILLSAIVIYIRRMIGACDLPCQE